MRRRQNSHRRDDNHAAIVEALRACGWHVQDTSQVGKGCPDAMAFKRGRCVPIEIKDGAKVPSARKLSPAEEKAHKAFAAAGCPVVVIQSVEEAVRL